MEMTNRCLISNYLVEPFAQENGTIGGGQTWVHFVEKVHFVRQTIIDRLKHQTQYEFEVVNTVALHPVNYFLKDHYVTTFLLLMSSCDRFFTPMIPSLTGITLPSKASRASVPLSIKSNLVKTAKVLNPEYEQHKYN